MACEGAAHVRGAEEGVPSTGDAAGKDCLVQREVAQDLDGDFEREKGQKVEVVGARDDEGVEVVPVGGVEEGREGVEEGLARGGGCGLEEGEERGVR